MALKRVELPPAALEDPLLAERAVEWWTAVAVTESPILLTTMVIVGGFHGWMRKSLGADRIE